MAPSGAKYCEKGWPLQALARGDRRKKIRTFDFWAADFVNAGFWRLRAPETSIWAPEGAFGTKRQFFRHFFVVFSWIFRVLAPLGLVTLVRKPSFQAVIKSAASAASQIQGTQVQGSARSVARAPIRRPAALKSWLVPFGTG